MKKTKQNQWSSHIEVQQSRMNNPINQNIPKI